MIGVYSIKNLINGKFYIGSSQNIQRRKYYHFSLLKRGCHKNFRLQQAINKYGLENFVFEILEICELPILIDKEQEWIDKFWNDGMLYNIAQKAGASFRGRKHSNKTIKKMKNWQKKHGNSMKGKTHSNWSKNQIILSCTEKFKFRRRLTEEQIKELYQLHRDGFSSRALGKKFNVSKTTILKILNGKRYNSVSKI